MTPAPRFHTTSVVDRGNWEHRTAVARHVGEAGAHRIIVGTSS